MSIPEWKKFQLELEAGVKRQEEITREMSKYLGIVKKLNEKIKEEGDIEKLRVLTKQKNQLLEYIKETFVWPYVEPQLGYMTTNELVDYLPDPKVNELG